MSKAIKATHVTTISSLMWMVDGKLTELKLGHPMTLSDVQAEKLGRKVRSVKDVKPVDAESQSVANDADAQLAQAEKDAQSKK